MTSADFTTILAYHQATKHHFDRYARSAGYMDWANQPNPFRTYEGASQVALPLSAKVSQFGYDRLYSAVQTPSPPFTRESVGAFFLYALGLSAWKSDGAARWPLRINPSSGNLHPTEGYLITPQLEELPAGVYHYAPLAHAFERRALLPQALADRLAEHLGGRGFYVALSSIFWRESWKYGERAFRYCQLDVGHALAALALAARLNGWRLAALTGAGDDQIESMLGFDRTQWLPLEDETAEVLCRVYADDVEGGEEVALPADLVAGFAELELDGRPNRLSRQPVDWSIITRAARAVRKPTLPVKTSVPAERRAYFPPTRHLSAAALLRQRRSAVGYNPQKPIAASSLFAILERTLPVAAAPFDLQLMSPAVDLAVFVHRVRDVPSGLYYLARRAQSLDSLRSSLDPEFGWEPVVAELPLYLLKARDMTWQAMALSCHQDIAGDSALAIAMLADFEPLIARHPFVYRYLHWECGMIGQLLYLEAEAQGLRGTGIGCFFDDEVHRLLGVADLSRQVLYHFTLGYSVEDRRLTTLPPYHHRDVV